MVSTAPRRPAPQPDPSAGLPPPGRANHLVLVADDEPAVAALLREVLEADGHQVVTAPDGPAALARAAACRPDLAVLDLDMPGVGGLEVCRRLKADPATRLAPVLVLTGRDPADARLAAWDLGADEYLGKPFRPAEVAARCRALLRHKDLVDELETAEAVVFSLARAVEAKSPYTHGHAGRVAAYAGRLGGRAGLDPVELAALGRGAALHDIGKLSVPDAVLDKAGRLTPAERAAVERHPAAGARIVEPLRSLRDAVPFILWHHERMDGGGYPDGRRAGDLPAGVRVLAVADVYDALASDRPYRPALPHPRCLEVLAADAAGGGLDPALVRLFAEAVDGPVGRPD